MPVIKTIEMPLHCYLLQNPRLQEKREKIFNISKTCDSDYRVRCHRSRGDSGQYEAERTNSDIADVLVDGATLECDRFKRFGDLSAEEVRSMSLHDYKKYEKERMAKSAW